jgi:hypothetical protein
MGTGLDMKRRETLKRSDTKDHRSIIERARDWIFCLGYGVGSKSVEALLGAKSWVPTWVCAALPCQHKHDTYGA